MDKERLEELRDNVIDYKNTRAFDLCFEECDEIVALIDAEIVRQSATDEDVKDAIAWAEQERKHSFRYMDFGDADSASLAITALQAYQPTTRKNRIVEEVAISKTETTSCEWCEKTGKYAGFAYATFFEQTAPDEEYECSVECNYCPNCGRPLPAPPEQEG